jgi:hypothetical protein
LKATFFRCINGILTYSMLMKVVSTGLLLILLSMLYLIEVWGKWLRMGARLLVMRGIGLMGGIIVWLVNRENWQMPWVEATYLTVLVLVIFTIIPGMVAQKGSANVLLELMAPFVRRRQVGEHHLGKSRYVIDFSKNVPLFMVLVCMIVGIFLSGIFLLSGSFYILIMLGLVLGLLVGLFGFVLMSTFIKKMGMARE